MSDGDRAEAATDDGRPPEPGEPWPGRSYPLGATWDGAGTNFALVAPAADAVEVCLFDEAGRETRLRLDESTAGVRHGYVPGVGPGQRYGFRVHGPFDPTAGRRANPAKLLADPYARAFDGDLVLTGDAFAGDAATAVFGYPPGGDDTARDLRDSAPFVPKSVVVADGFDWGGDHAPGTAWADTVVYELHVKGFTRRHPGVPERLRGTYAGLASPAAVDHLVSLGVTAVELLPVHQFVSEPALARRGLGNYWGYNTLGFFAPHNGYSSSGTRGEQVGEFKAMVRTLHAAGIEVILDVVYNHTAEGDHLGPTLSLRGIDNVAYYRLRPDDPRRYLDFTGTGNTLDVRHPPGLRLVMDSLRYWVTEMHVDGFRFDLAPALARSTRDVDMHAAFLDVVAQDPVVGQVKLVAEPWDLGEGGYRLGEFPAPWTEWNGKFRDTVRDFWRGTRPPLAQLGYRLSGSSDLFQDDGRRPCASVNFVTAHDGFTLRDLVTYAHKHNEANGEDNRDGTDDNRSTNFGVEGETDDPVVRARRARQMRNLLATLLLSTGVPMVTAGDETGRTQHGNNNAYSQDNSISWLDWELDDEARALLDFTRRVLRLRREHPVFRQCSFFLGRPVGDGVVKDLGWFTPHGREIVDDDWRSHEQTIGMYLAGSGIRERGPRGQRIIDDSFLVLLHAGAEPCPFTLPGPEWAPRYEVVLDTAAEVTVPGERPGFGVTGSARAGGAGGTTEGVDAGSTLCLAGRSLVVLRAHA